MNEAKAVKERFPRRKLNAASALAAAALLGAGATFGAMAGSGAFAQQGQAIAQPLGSQMERPSAPMSFAPIVKQVRPAVVSVRARTGGEPAQSSLQQRQFRNWPDNFNIPEWFRDMFPDRSIPDPFQTPRRPGRRSLAQGSGFIISEDGYVVTNYHVVDKAAEVELVLDDGTNHTARIIGADSKTDLALLKIDADREFPYVAFTDKEIEIGDWVLAVGNPFGLGGSVTVGVVSARGRDIGAGLYDDFIQIDAPINRGNSGGPTFNLDGEVVGINTAIFSPSGGSVGIGFAIPAEVARNVIIQLRESGSVTRGWLGVQIQPVTRDIADSLGLEEAAGALVADVQDNSPAKRAGLRVGDIILQVDGRNVTDARDLARKIGARNPNERASIKILREGKEQAVSVRLGRQEDERQASLSPEPPAQTPIDRLGLSLRAAADMPDVAGDGVVITDVQDGSEAAAKGLEAGDVILMVDNRAVKTPEDVTKIIAELAEAERGKVLFYVRSERGQQFVPLELGRS